MPVSPLVSPRASALLVVCLCAQWCGTCRDYRAAVAQVQRELGSAAVDFAWVDIEDQADVVDDIDVDDFPTVLIVQGEALLFFGTVLPHTQTLLRLVRSALDGGLGPVAEPPAAARALARRVRAEPALLLAAA
jgi:thioredoxin 1